MRSEVEDDLVSLGARHVLMGSERAVEESYKQIKEYF